MKRIVNKPGLSALWGLWLVLFLFCGCSPVQTVSPSGSTSSIQSLALPDPPSGIERFYGSQGFGTLSIQFNRSDLAFKTQANNDPSKVVVKISSPKLSQDRLETHAFAEKLELKGVPAGLVNIYIELVDSAGIVMASGRRSVRIFADHTVGLEFALALPPENRSVTRLEAKIQVLGNTETVTKLEVKVFPTEVRRNESMTLNINADADYSGKFEVDFGDGVKQIFDSRVVVHQYTQPGSYAVKVRAPGDNGAVYENGVNLKVLDQTTPASQQFPAAPEIVSIEPKFASIGEKVTIKGRNFATTAEGNTILFNGNPAKVLTASNNQLEVEVPQGATLNSTIVAKKSQPFVERFIDLVPVSEGTEGDFKPSQNVTLSGTHHYGGVHIPQDVTLRAEGSQPLILYANGDVIIDGVIDGNGNSGQAHGYYGSFLTGQCPGYPGIETNDPRGTNSGGSGGAGGSRGGSAGFGSSGAGEGVGGGAGANNGPPAGGQFVGDDTLSEFRGGSGGGAGTSLAGSYANNYFQGNRRNCVYEFSAVGDSGGGGGLGKEVVVKMEMELENFIAGSSASVKTQNTPFDSSNDSRLVAYANNKLVWTARTASKYHYDDKLAAILVQDTLTRQEKLLTGFGDEPYIQYNSALRRENLIDSPPNWYGAKLSPDGRYLVYQFAYFNPATIATKGQGFGLFIKDLETGEAKPFFTVSSSHSFWGGSDYYTDPDTPTAIDFKWTSPTSISGVVRYAAYEHVRAFGVWAKIPFTASLPTGGGTSLPLCDELLSGLYGRKAAWFSPVRSPSCPIDEDRTFIFNPLPPELDPELKIDLKKVFHVYSPDSYSSSFGSATRKKIAYLENANSGIIHIHNFTNGNHVSINDLGTVTGGENSILWTPDSAALVVSTTTGTFLISPEGQVKIKLNKDTVKLLGWSTP